MLPTEDSFFVSSLFSSVSLICVFKFKRIESEREPTILPRQVRAEQVLQGLPGER